MYPAVAVLCRLLGVPDESVGVIKKNGVSTYYSRIVRSMWQFAGKMVGSG